MGNSFAYQMVIAFYPHKSPQMTARAASRLRFSRTQASWPASRPALRRHIRDRSHANAPESLSGSNRLGQCTIDNEVGARDTARHWTREEDGAPGGPLRGGPPAGRGEPHCP